MALLFCAGKDFAEQQKIDNQEPEVK